MGRSRFWEVLCAGTAIWTVLFGVCIVFLVLMLLSVYLTPPEPASAHIIVINVAILIPFVLILAFTIRKCRSGEY